MKSLFLNKYGKIHIVGIGGIGMSAIARVLVQMNYSVSGSDATPSSLTHKLETEGIKILKGHKAENIGDAELVIYSSAIKSDNPELREAKRKNVPVVKRPEILSAIMKLGYGIGIAGSHGKTTVTSMVTSIFRSASLSPTVVVGGIIQELGESNAVYGDGEYVVMEADEYDRTFLALNPDIAVITNVEAEHLDIYGNYESVKDAFVEFANKVPFYGAVFCSVENEGVKEILPKINSPVITYGFNPKADIVAVNVDSNEHGTSFDVGFKGDNLGRFELRLFGKHNVLNSLAAIGVAKELRIDNETIRHALSRFSGAERRFQLLYDGNVKIVDDYAHHPTEIRATIDAARSLASGRIISVFQPHLFTRTRDFYKEFAKALSETDVIVVLDVYPAREEPLPGITGELIAEELKRLGKDNVYFMAKKRKLPSLLRKIIRDGDLIIAMGAGDITALIHEFAEEMKRTEESK